MLVNGRDFFFGGVGEHIGEGGCRVRERGRDRKICQERRSGQIRRK